MLLEGETHVDIIDKYSGKGKEVTFKSIDLTNHKKHLHLDQVTVLDNALKNNSSNRVKYNNTKEISVNNSGGKKLLNSVAASIMSKGKRLHSLELMQIAKIDVAKRIYEDIKHIREKDFTVVVPPDMDDVKAEEKLAKDWRLVSTNLASSEKQFLAYMDSISALQIQILKYFDDIQSPIKTANLSVIITTMQNSELDILKYLAGAINDKDQRVAVTQEVGRIFNKMNSDISAFIKSASNEEVGVNPVDAIYTEVREAIFEDISDEKRA